MKAEGAGLTKGFAPDRGQTRRSPRGAAQQQGHREAGGFDEAWEEHRVAVKTAEGQKNPASKKGSRSRCRGPISPTHDRGVRRRSSERRRSKTRRPRRGQSGRRGLRIGAREGRAERSTNVARRTRISVSNRCDEEAASKHCARSGDLSAPPTPRPRRSCRGESGRGQSGGDKAAIGQARRQKRHGQSAARKRRRQSAADQRRRTRRRGHGGSGQGWSGQGGGGQAAATRRRRTGRAPDRRGGGHGAADKARRTRRQRTKPRGQPATDKPPRNTARTIRHGNAATENRADNRRQTRPRPTSRNQRTQVQSGETSPKSSMPSKKRQRPTARVA